MGKKISKAFAMTFLLLSLSSCYVSTSTKEREAGKEYYRQGYYPYAITKYSEAIKIEPDYWIHYDYRSKAYQKMNKIDLAILDLNKALELIPKIERWYSKLPHDEWALIYARRGALFNQKQLYELAIKDFNKALELDAECASAYYYRAAANEEINQFQTALEDYSKAIDLVSGIFSSISDTNKMEVYFKRGTIFFRLEQFEKAIKDFDGSIKIDPASAENAYSYLYRASARLMSSCDLHKALNDYHSVLNIQYVNYDIEQITYNEAAWLFATAENDKIRNGKKALKYAKKSVEMNRHFGTLDTLAAAYAECGEYGRAVETINQAIDLCKANYPELLPEIENHLNTILLKKPIREKCPGTKITQKLLRKWQNEAL